MKAIVFGANGYLGTSIVDELTKNGFDVTTTSRSSSETEFQTKNGFNEIISSGKKFNACIRPRPCWRAACRLRPRVFF